MANYSVDELASALMTKGGYNRTDAYNAANNKGGRADDLAREFLGVSSATNNTGDGSPEQTVNDIMATQKAQIEAETKFLEGYTKDNPFVFDEQLARQSSKAEYEPYYSELLQDYLSGTELKRATIQDETKLLDTMHQIDTGQKSRAYTRAVAQAEEGYNGQGMFFSGIKKRALGAGEVEQKATQEGSQAQYATSKAGLGREETALNLDVAQKQRDIGREQTANIESGILTRKNEAQTQYYTPLIQSYFRQFPSSSGGALQGYVLPDYLRY
jgi:hypothetical protein